MFRKVLDGFTATHFTILAGIAIIAPTALWGAVSASQVIITDANQHLAQVTGGKLQVYNPVSDPRQAYTTDPNNFVTIFFNLFSNSCATTYTVPSGKALVVTSVTGENAKSDTTGRSALTFLYNGATCSGSLVGTAGSGDDVSETNQTFSPGIVIPAGGSLSLYSSNNVGYAYAHGYLVPATAVAATMTAAAAPQDSAAVAAKINGMRHR